LPLEKKGVYGLRKSLWKSPDSRANFPRGGPTGEMGEFPVIGRRSDWRSVKTGGTK